MARAGDEPVLSIVIPVYNGEKYIGGTIKNVLGMTDTSFELLLIDDGSVDGSAAICKAYAAQDARIRYVYRKNAGIAEARNRGLELAEGKYVCFWDQDDISLYDGIAALLSKVRTEAAQVGICSSSRLIVQAKMGSSGSTPEDCGMSPYEMLHDAVYRGNGVRDGLLYPLLFRGYDYPFAASEDYFYGSVWKCIFLLSFIRENGICFKRFVGYEDDWIFVTHALSRADCAVTSQTPGYCWRVNMDSESHRERFIPDLAERFEELDKCVSSYINRCITDEEVRRAYRQVTFCDHYVELVRNDAGHRNDQRGVTDGKKGGMVIRQYRESVKQYMVRTDYRVNLEARKRLKGSAHRKKLILVIIAIAGIRIAYIMSKVYDVLERRLERSSWITGLERKRKMNDR